MANPLIVGLGNPSPEYDHTRHNIGRELTQKMLIKQTPAGFLSALLGAIGNSEPSPINIKNFQGKAYKLQHLNQKLIVVTDLGTYMNTSGPALERVLSFLNLNHSALIVVHDDIDLPLGKIRVSVNSSSAGHNGVQSIITALRTKEFTRIRIGVESRQNKNQPSADKFVLQKFSAEEQNIIDSEIIPESIQKILVTAKKISAY